MYVSILEDDMTVLPVPRRTTSCRREGNRTTCHRAVTVTQYMEEGLHVHKSRGGETTVCVVGVCRTCISTCVTVTQAVYIL